MKYHPTISLMEADTLKAFRQNERKYIGNNLLYFEDNYDSDNDVEMEEDEVDIIDIEVTDGVHGNQNPKRDKNDDN